MRSVPTSNWVEAEIGALYSRSRSELLEYWRKLNNAAPPKGISRALMIRAIAYGLQAKHYGGLKPTVARRLDKFRGGASLEARREGNGQSSLQPGSRLVREWNGSTHVVEVADGHFIWNGARYRSLSAIARAITGTRWSGPRFFSLTLDRKS